MSVAEADTFVTDLLSSFGFRRNSDKRFTPIRYGKTYGNHTLTVFHIKPYLNKNSRDLPKKNPVAPHAIWLEAGFEAANVAGVQLVLEVHEFLLTACGTKPHLPFCSYDYYILPEANPDGLLHAKDDLDWMKTMEPTSGACVGVNLLNNFEHGRFADGDGNECSEKYRGPHAMSSVETTYQTKIKELTNANIVLSVTISKLGSVITAPHAHTLHHRFDEQRSTEYMDVFTRASGAYTSGFYSEVHGMDYGHPLDYNAFKFGNSFNVAIEEGTINEDNHYEHAKNRTTAIFVDFAKGFFSLANHAVEQSKRQFNEH